jgi:hypothetical protein
MFSKTESKYAFFYVTTQQKSAVSLKINEKNTQNAKERKKQERNSEGETLLLG